MNMLPQTISWMVIHSLWIGLLCWALVRIFNSLTSHAMLRKYFLLGSLVLFVAGLLLVMPSPTGISEMSYVVFYTSEAAVPAGDWWTQTTLWINSNSTIISLFWLAGMCFTLVRLGQSHRSMKRYQIGAVNYNDSQLINRITGLQRKLGIKRKVVLKISSLINSPMCTGFIKPIIYLPIGLSNGLLEDELDAILQHELAHIKHHDFIVNYALVLMETIFFFNPMVLLLTREIRQEMEYACDDLVTQHESPITYSRALVKLQELKLESALALAANNKNSELKKRINRMINSNNKRKNPGAAIIAVVLATFMIGSAFTTNNTDPEPTKTEKAPVVSSLQEAQTDTLRFTDMKALQAKVKELGFKDASKSVFMLNGKHIRVILDTNKSLKKGEDMMKEIQKELIADGLLSPERPKMTLMFQYSDLLNGKANLGSHYAKYKGIFNRYFPKYDSYACTKVFRYNAE